jgi:hypothetical protein
MITLVDCGYFPFSGERNRRKLTLTKENLVPQVNPLQVSKKSQADRRNAMKKLILILTMAILTALTAGARETGRGNSTAAKHPKAHARAEEVGRGKKKGLKKQKHSRFKFWHRERASRK